MPEGVLHIYQHIFCIIEGFCSQKVGKCAVLLLPSSETHSNDFPFESRKLRGWLGARS